MMKTTQNVRSIAGALIAASLLGCTAHMGVARSETANNPEQYQEQRWYQPTREVPGFYATPEFHQVREGERHYLTRDGVAWTGPAVVSPTPVFNRDVYLESLRKAESQLQVDKDFCNTMVGRDRSICIREADAAYISAKADANATHLSWEAQMSAWHLKNDAYYNVALERCNLLSGFDRNICLSKTKTQFNK